VIGDGDVATHRQAVHEMTILLRGAEPWLGHAPVGETASQLSLGLTITVVNRRAPLLGIQDMRAGERRGALAGLGDRAAACGRRAPRSLHHRVGERKALGAQHHDVHSALRRHVHGRGRHGQRQGARVIHPGEHKTPAPRDAEIVERFPIGERLAGVIRRRLEIDERLVAERGHELEGLFA
jgi:hypothetical protein